MSAELWANVSVHLDWSSASLTCMYLLVLLLSETGGGSVSLYWRGDDMMYSVVSMVTDDIILKKSFRLKEVLFWTNTINIYQNNTKWNKPIIAIHMTNNFLSVGHFLRCHGNWSKYMHYVLGTCGTQEMVYYSREHLQHRAINNIINNQQKVSP